MSRKRLVLLICIALLALLIIGGVIGSLLRVFYELKYSLELFLPYWLVGPVLFLGTVLIVILIIQVGHPWLKELQNKKPWLKRKRKDVIDLPKSRRHAAQQSLQSIDRLIEYLQDNISRKGLVEERRRVGQELARGDLVVVIFGTGSSGKTSLIRALLNEIVGKVGAAMGSTTTSKSYRLRLKGFDRGLKLIDTPGVLEAGKDGLDREKQARKIASQSDLMVVVVDGDLRASELRIIQSLSNLGKRLLLALNKCDLRGEEEERKLLSVLRSRCRGLIKPEDIIPVSAAPQSVPRPGLKPLQPPAEVNSLVQRLASVLHSEGEELLADNILLQCRHLGDAGRRLLDRQRKIEAINCIERYSWITGGVVMATPLPGVDLLGTAAVNAQMVMEIAKVYGIEITRARAQELAISVGRTLAGLGVIKGGITIIEATLSLSIPTLILSRSVQGVAAAWLTRVAGESFITYFQQDQDWGDGGIQEVVQKHYNLNSRKTSMEKFLELALKRVVEPMHQDRKRRRLPPRPKPRGEVEAWDLENPEE
ncbi:YcjF family protein [Prochlorococcus sp. MIT 1341]|uniref:YcjF family protein n=1 Tax=Prochlorococcus sp. MIT 1341 TaxID=3096221 RepID=UPI002A756BF7|nr:DUF697 domain-containing protein [Prochlorococcus sp. MIT 1341]